ncbi:MAG TPA: NADH-quinone oxidoreductase subunit M [Verrucomicrobiae bacterium]|jgi:NADH-quinone oxidoreductase subunit M
MSLLTLIFLLPLAAALVLALIPGNYRFVIRCLALLATCASMVLAVVAFCKFAGRASAPGFQFEEQHAWASSAGISYHVGADGLNMGLILMGAVVLFAAVCVSWRINTREKEYYVLLLLMGGGILGAFASLDLFFFYVLHELALVPAFILIGVWGAGKDKNYAAYQITLYLSLGALLVLAGLLAVYLQMPAGARTFDIVKLTAYFKANPMQAGAQHWIFPLLLFGFGILVSLYPFHTWAPTGYGSAPTGAAMIHAGVLKKFGLYGLLRVALPLMPESAQRWAAVIAILGLGNIIWCGAAAMRQRDLNLLIGNSSVAHVGFAFLGIASMSLIGFTGAVVIMVAHGFLAALTFALSGYLRDELKTLDMDQMGGLLKRLPFIGTVMIMAMMAGCGLPGFAGFFGEALVFFGGWARSETVTVLAIWGALIIAGVYMLRAIRSIWHGEKDWDNLADLTSFKRRMPYGLLLAGLIVFGCFPRLLTDHITASVTPVAQLVSAVPGGPR